MVAVAAASSCARVGLHRVGHRLSVRDRAVVVAVRPFLDPHPEAAVGVEAHRPAGLPRPLGVQVAVVAAGQMSSPLRKEAQRRQSSIFS